MSAEHLTMPLSGTWRFAIDRQDQGIPGKWFNGLPSDETVTLPGSMLDNGKGDDITLETKWVGRIRDTSFYEDDKYEPYRQPGNIKLPFFLTPLKHYMGVAWYQRTIEIPEEWEGKLVQLSLERPHWTTKVFIDDREVGEGLTLATPHYHLLGKLTPGSHVLSIRIDNRMYVDVGEDAHSVTDQTQTNWNGVVGDICIVARPDAWLKDLQVYPAPDRKSVRVAATIHNDTMGPGTAALKLLLHDSSGVALGSATAEVLMEDRECSIETTIAVEEAVVPWDEFHPALYHLRAELLLDDEVIDVRSERFGFRHFETRRNMFFLNGKHHFLRGTHEGCTFPKTGYPPTDKESWTRIFRIIKDHGLNHMRFHSWCPPKAAFDAADEEGIIISAECSCWTTVGFDEKFEQWLYHEADRILEEYGNHPSFCMMLYGNEPYGPRSAIFLAEFVEHYKAKDRRRLYSSGTAWPLIPENEFQVWANPRIQYWDENLDSRINSKPPETITDYSSFLIHYPQPVITHEIGQWCVYPNFEEISQYDGPLKPGNYEIFRDFLEASGQGDQATEFLMASGMLQLLCYKEEVESALRTPGMGGFHLLDLHDYTGQGTAIIGVLDVFWNPKPYVTAEEYRRFAGPVVPLARLEKRVFTNNETFSAELLVSHFGAEDLPAGDVQWRLSANDGAIAYSGNLPFQDKLVAGDLHTIGRIQHTFNSETEARKLNLEVTLPGKDASNDWDIWVYPEKLNVTPTDDVLVTGALDEAALVALRSGGKVLLMPDVEQITGDERGQVPPGFSSIFWNTAWTQGQKPHTLGILCDPAHPGLAHFPTEYHSNWQWWYIIQRSRSMFLNPLPAEIKPIVQVIDDWFTARRLGLVFECMVEGGKLLVSSIDVKDSGENDPVCRQMLYSLLKYASSSDFQPDVNLSAEELAKVILPPDH